MMNYPTQQYPPQYPQQPGYPQQFAQPQPAAFPPQQFVPQPMPVAPAQPLAQGTIDEFYGQPSTGGGPAISWKNKADGTTYGGIVARDVTNADVPQETDPQTKQPKFYRDGRPKFVMKVTLQVQPTPEFPEGEATLYVRGQMRDELVRAMAEAGTSGAPKAGDTIVVTLTHRKPTNSLPQNIFAIRYIAASGAGAPSPAAAPIQQAPAQQPVPQQQFVPQQPVPQQQFVPQQPVPQQQFVPAQSVQQAPAQGVAVPPDFSPEQAALLQQMTGGAQA